MKKPSPAEPPPLPLPRSLADLFAPVDATAVVFFRVTFGLVLALDQLHYTLGKRLEETYLIPNFLFKYPGFEWVRTGPEWTLRLFFWGLFALGLMIAAGLFYRVATTLFFLGYCYFILVDYAAYNNHYYLTCLIALTLIFVPAHRVGSLDARRDPRVRSSTVPAWGVWLLRFHVALPYFFGGLAKINWDWLARAQPMRLWLSTGIAEERFGSSRLLQEPWVAYFFSWGGLAFDLLIVPLLLWRRTRLPAFLVAVGFHMNNVFMFKIGFFPWLMIAATTIFFAPGWPRRAGLAGRRPPVTAPAPASPNRRQLVAAALCAAYLALQVLLPFRHFLYPGWVDWTEEGHRFSWRMKLRDKRGDIQFILLDHATRKATVLEDHESMLTSTQQLMMAQDPEMIRQFAHFLARRFRQEGHQGFEIHANTSLSLNGRPPQPLVDPTVDLAATPPGLFGSKDWVVPLQN